MEFKLDQEMQRPATRGRLVFAVLVGATAAMLAGIMAAVFAMSARTGHEPPAARDTHRSQPAQRTIEIDVE